MAFDKGFGVFKSYASVVASNIDRNPFFRRRNYLSEINRPLDFSCNLERRNFDSVKKKFDSRSAVASKNWDIFLSRNPRVFVQKFDVWRSFLHKNPRVFVRRAFLNKDKDILSGKVSRVFRNPKIFRNPLDSLPSPVGAGNPVSKSTEGWKEVKSRKKMKGGDSKVVDRSLMKKSGEMITCFNCGEKGHSKFSCVSKPLCFLCKDTGHKSEECFYMKKTEYGRLLAFGSLHRTQNEGVVERLNRFVCVSSLGDRISEKMLCEIFAKNWPRKNWTWSVFPLADQKFFVRCPNQLLVDNLTKMKSFNSGGVNLVFDSWNMIESPTEFVEKQNGVSWFAVRNYPKDQWNWVSINNTFKPFGSLLEVDDRNVNLVKFDELRIKLKCSDLNRVPDILVLEDEGKFFNVEICRLTGNRFYKKPYQSNVALANSDWGSWNDSNRGRMQWVPKEKGKKALEVSGAGVSETQKDDGDKNVIDSNIEGFATDDNLVTFHKKDLLAITTSDNSDFLEKDDIGVTDSLKSDSVLGAIPVSNSFAALNCEDEVLEEIVNNSVKGISFLNTEVKDLQAMPNASVLRRSSPEKVADSENIDTPARVNSPVMVASPAWTASPVINSSAAVLSTPEIVPSSVQGADEHDTPPHPDSSPDKERRTFLLTKRMDNPGNLVEQDKGKRKKKLPPQPVKFSARLMSKGKGPVDSTFCLPAACGEEIQEYWDEDELRRLLLKRRKLSLEANAGAQSAIWSIKANYKTDSSDSSSEEELC